jgi:hypothetical protein
MLRKLAIAAATSAALALSLAPSGASARAVGGHVGVGHVGVGHVGGWGRAGAWGHPGFGRFGVHRFHRFGFRRGPFFAGAYPWYGTCWRVVPGPFGLHRVWVCGYRPYAWRAY